MKKRPGNIDLTSEVALLRKRVLKLEQSAAEANYLIDNLQAYIRQSIYLHEIDNQQTAHTLRENILQNLAAINLAVESVFRLSDTKPETIVPTMVELQQRINQTIRQVRELSYQFKSEVLECLGLSEAIESLVDEWQSDCQTPIRFSIQGREKEVTPVVRDGIYRIAQEALKNACLHSRASVITVRLHFGTRNIKLEISDNGQGFSVPSQFMHLAGTGKTGLIIMEKWTQILNGQIKIQSGTNRKTIISVEVPAEFVFKKNP